MEEAIKIFMSADDADCVEQIFKETELPNFTILSRTNVMGNYSILEIYADLSCSLWQLAKNVEFKAQWKKRREDAIEWQKRFEQLKESYKNNSDGSKL